MRTTSPTGLPDSRIAIGGALLTLVMVMQLLATLHG